MRIHNFDFGFIYLKLRKMLSNININNTLMFIINYFIHLSIQSIFYYEIKSWYKFIKKKK